MTDKLEDLFATACGATDFPYTVAESTLIRRAPTDAPALRALGQQELDPFLRSRADVLATRLEKPESAPVKALGQLREAESAARGKVVSEPAPGGVAVALSHAHGDRLVSFLAVRLV